jgi:metal-sulfur cluster biosynthetic enzyme
MPPLYPSGGTDRFRRPRRSHGIGRPGAAKSLRSLEEELMPTQDEVREALRDVQDPELMMSMVDLGLIYGIEVAGEHDEDVKVTMTFTSPMCPVGPEFKKSVEDKVNSLEGVKSVAVEITFVPPWDPRIHASEDAKFDLGIWF